MIVASFFVLLWLGGNEVRQELPIQFLPTGLSHLPDSASLLASISENSVTSFLPCLCPESSYIKAEADYFEKPHCKLFQLL